MFLSLAYRVLSYLYIRYNLLHKLLLPMDLRGHSSTSSRKWCFFNSNLCLDIQFLSLPPSLSWSLIRLLSYIILARFPLFNKHLIFFLLCRTAVALRAFFIPHWFFQMVFVCHLFVICLFAVVCLSCCSIFVLFILALSLFPLYVVAF